MARALTGNTADNTCNRRDRGKPAASGACFTFAESTEGAVGSPDSLLLSLAAEVDVGNNFTLAGLVESELSVTRQTYGGSVKVSRRW